MPCARLFEESQGRCAERAGIGPRGKKRLKAGACMDQMALAETLHEIGELDELPHRELLGT